MPDEQWSAGYDAGVKAGQRDVASITDAAIEKAIEFGEQKERARIVAALRAKTDVIAGECDDPAEAHYCVLRCAELIERGEL